MLTKEENSWNFRAIRYMSLVNWLPLRMDLNSGQIEMVKTPVRRWLWRVFYGLGIIHLLYVTARLVESVLVPEYFKLEHFVVHFLYVGWFYLHYFWALMLFVRHPAECTLVFNHLFKENRENQNEGQEETAKDGNESIRKEKQMRLELESVEMEMMEQGRQESKKKERGASPSRRSIFDYTFHELLSLCMSFFLWGTNFITFGVLLTDTSRTQYLYYSLSEDYKNPVVFTLLFIFEGFFQCMVAAFAFFSFLVQLEFLERCEQEFNHLDEKLRKLYKELPSFQPQMLDGILREIRELTLFIEMFNRCFPFVVFSCKIYCLTICIMFYFFTIRHIDDHPYFILFTCHLGNSCFILYCAVYHKAFRVPRDLDELKVGLQMVSNVSPAIRRELRREIRRFHCAGIRVGSFNTMERTSTLDFLQFVVENVVSLLVTFPK